MSTVPEKPLLFLLFCDWNFILWPLFVYRQVSHFINCEEHSSNGMVHSEGRILRGMSSILAGHEKYKYFLLAVLLVNYNINQNSSTANTDPSAINSKIVEYINTFQAIVMCVKTFTQPLLYYEHRKP
jgi:hypothetical protein